MKSRQAESMTTGKATRVRLARYHGDYVATLELDGQVVRIYAKATIPIHNGDVVAVVGKLNSGVLVGHVYCNHSNGTHYAPDRRFDWLAWVFWPPMLSLFLIFASAVPHAFGAFSSPLLTAAWLIFCVAIVLRKVFQPIATFIENRRDDARQLVMCMQVAEGKSLPAPKSNKQRTEFHAARENKLSSLD